ncbi:MAG: SDR family oxidoreductase [Myxococcales bacterium]|jgi:pteridine reductase
MTELAGKRALVTGAGRRVGAAIALALGRRGMRVAVHYNRSSEGAASTAQAIRDAGGDALTLAGDLYDREAARRLVDAAVERLGGLDLLVASAANFDAVEFDDIDDRDWDRALDLNLTAPFVMAHRARAALRASHGSIVLVTCISRRAPYRGFLPYEVSKAGTHQLMRLLALELAPEVRVNAVAPGSVLPPPEWDAEQLLALTERIPIGRVGRAEDVADAVVHLAEHDFMTGEELVVDGGRSLR